MSTILRAAAACGLAAALAAQIDEQIVADPALARNWIPDKTSVERWNSLFDPTPQWAERDVAALALTHPRRLPTLWAARLLYRGEPWTRRDNEPSSPRRWRAVDRTVKLAILRDLRWRRDAVFVPVLSAFLQREDGDAALVASALSALWLVAPEEGRAHALRIADPRAEPARLLPSCRLPAARMYALALLMDDPAATAQRRPALEFALLSRPDDGESLAALARLRPGEAPDLVAGSLAKLAQRLREGRLNDEAIAAAVLACSRLGDAVDEATARSLAEMAAGGPRELACAAAAALARSVTWRNAIDPAPIIARLGREDDAAVRHALFAVLLRVLPARVAEAPGAGGWAALARHRLALQDWAWNRYLGR